MKSEFNTFLQSLIKEKPYTVVQNLFQEKSLEAIMQISKQIQQAIKTKTSELKKIFESKYGELINTSELIERLKRFSEQIEQITAQMHENMQKNNGEDMLLPSKKSNNPIKKIEKLVRQQNYLDAMHSCNQERIKPDTSFQIRTLIQIIESDIVETVFTKLEEQLTDTKIIVFIETLSLFLFNNASIFLKQSNLEKDYGIHFSSMIQKYRQICTENIQVSNYPLYVSLLTSINVIFEIKILSINVNNNKESLSKFVKDIQLILLIVQNQLSQIYKKLEKVVPAKKQQSRIKGQLDNQTLLIKYLKVIFQSSFKTLHTSLAKSMIIYQRNKQQNILFNHTLYRQILNDEILLKQFEVLEVKFESNVKIQEILNSLWNDFYNQITDYLLEQIEPAGPLNDILQKYMKNLKNQPELAKFKSDKLSVYLLEYLENYMEKVQTSFSQICTLFNDDNKPQNPESMLLSLVEKFDIYFKKNLEFFAQFLKKIQQTQIKLKYILEIEMIMSSFTSKAALLISIQNSELLKRSLENFQRGYKQILVEESRIILTQEFNFKENLESNCQNLQLILIQFIVYLNESAKFNGFRPLLQKIVLEFMSNLLNMLEGRQKEKLKYTIKILENGKVEISTYTCLFSFLPEYLFDHNLKPERFNLKLYESLLKQEKYPKRSFKKRELKITTADRNLFEISEKDNNNEQIMKIASKSIYDLGNSLAGLFNRKGK